VLGIIERIDYILESKQINYKSEQTMKLYELNKEIEKVIDRMVDSDGVIMEGQDGVLKELEEELEELEVTRNEKILNTAKYIKNKTVFVNALKAEEKALSTRRKSLEKQLEWLELYVLDNIEKGEELEDAQVLIKTRASQKVNILDESLLPDEYVKLIPESRQPDKASIKKALALGEVPGAEIEHCTNLKIK